MNNFVVEIGNTAVKAAWTEGTVLGKTFRYQGEKVRDFIVSSVKNEKPAVMVIASAYEISAGDKALYAGLCGKLVVLDGSDKELVNDKNIPGWLSPDREASIMAARHLFKNKSFTLFDFGTTLTVDMVNADGTYCGGNISLGCRTRFKALNRYSRALPLVSTPDDTPLLGTDFTTSITSGIISGIMFEIEGYLSSNSSDIIVFTGGDANYFAKRMKNSIFVICNLVLIGLALIADEYVNEID